MNLTDILTQDRVLFNLTANDRFEAITKVAQLLSNSPKIQSFAEFLDALLEAERAGLTWFEQEVAFPHIRSELVKELILAAGFFSPGVFFRENAPLVQLIFVIGAPKKISTTDIVVVGSLARIVSKNKNRLLNAKNAQKFISLLSEYEKQLQ